MQIERNMSSPKSLKSASLSCFIFFSHSCFCSKLKISEARSANYLKISSLLFFWVICLFSFPSCLRACLLTAMLFLALNFYSCVKFLFFSSFWYFSILDIAFAILMSRFSCYFTMRLLNFGVGSLNSS